MYECMFCKYKIDDVKASGIMHLVKCFLPVGSTSGAKRVQNEWIYAHRVCVETKEPMPEQGRLFG